jgi:hypothetical protein
MAFLDNSGDIILDAVLTTEGRRRMSAGTFNIRSYAFCDDEIDYGLFVLATGSAFQDLEILQTPVFEATTEVYPQSTLISTARNDILYMPVINTNTLVNSNPAVASDGFYYVAVNSETYTALIASTALGDKKYVLESNNPTGERVILEAGLDGAADDGILGTPANRVNYLVNMNMVDDGYMAYADSRFIGSLLGPKASSTLANNSTGMDVSSISMTTVAASAKTRWMDNYNTYALRGPANKIFYNSSTAATTISAINGPRSSFTALNVNVDTELTSIVGGARSAKYNLYGAIAQDLFSDGNTYDYIDTPVWVQGNTSLRQVRIDLRIIRRAS